MVKNLLIEEIISSEILNNKSKSLDLLENSYKDKNLDTFLFNIKDSISFEINSLSFKNERSSDFSKINRYKRWLIDLISNLDFEEIETNIKFLSILNLEFKYSLNIDFEFQMKFNDEKEIFEIRNSNCINFGYYKIYDSSNYYLYRYDNQKKTKTVIASSHSKEILENAITKVNSISLRIRDIDDKVKEELKKVISDLGIINSKNLIEKDFESFENLKLEIENFQEMVKLSFPDSAELGFQLIDKWIKKNIKDDWLFILEPNYYNLYFSSKFEWVHSSIEWINNPNLSIEK